VRNNKIVFNNTSLILTKNIMSSPINTFKKVSLIAVLIPLFLLFYEIDHTIFKFDSFGLSIIFLN